MERKTFQALYQEAKEKPTAAQQFVIDIAALTHRSETTVRMWLLGRQVPDELTKCVIAEKFGVEPSALFETDGDEKDNINH